MMEETILMPFMLHAILTPVILRHVYIILNVDGADPMPRVFLLIYKDLSCLVLETLLSTPHLDPSGALPDLVILISELGMRL